MRKLFKAILILLALVAITIAAAFAVFAFVTKDAKLDESKLTDYGRCITVCDRNGEEMTSASLDAKKKSVKLCDLSEDTINAFIASEDRNFFRHGGLNYARMLKALATNITSRSFSQGASTISQQLIKNTHLSGDKTIKRKLSEIKLTKKLEKKYPKEQILEMYLNTIYFGHNCYGLESAAEFYFGTTADKLTLEQSATVVGLLTSPNNYSPFKNPERCIKRRNTVLKCMLDCEFIDEDTYEKTAALPLSAKENSTFGGAAGYLSAVFDELEELGLDGYALTDAEIITYADKDLQTYVDSMQFDCDSAIIITAQDGGVKAYKSSIGGAKRQPGSTIKPLLVYAPAIEEKLICPATKILDEKINFGGYSPENHDKKYHGYLTAAESIAKSYNIPAVKTLNALTVGKAADYAEKMGIQLENDEKNLSLALGGMKHGLTIAELCEKYRAFTGGGAYTNTRFIKEIRLKNGKSIYRAESRKKRVFSQGTASLMNEMLEGSVKYGTAKRLNGFSFDIAAKTGTCGSTKGNTDAYCIAYTSSDAIGVWLGSKDNKPLEISSGTDCCEAAKQIFEKLYKNSAPHKLETEAGTATVEIDKDEYSDNNKIVLADSCAPKLSTAKIKVLANAVPTQISQKFSYPTIKTPAIKANDGNVCIELCQTKYYAYLIKRRSDGKEVTIYDGEYQKIITDEVAEGSYVYTVTPYYFDGVKKHYGKTIELPAVIVGGKSSPQQDLPDITQKDWFNE